ncbi:conserved hypothetical protein [delta proteobacterium NaphS2]|nr:conserved hypothetical protein [delta proteobacterium NaphS2]
MASSSSTKRILSCQGVFASEIHPCHFLRYFHINPKSLSQLTQLFRIRGWITITDLGLVAC